MDVNQLPPEGILKIRQFDSLEDSDPPNNALKKDPLRIKPKLMKPTKESSSGGQRRMTRTCHFCGREFAHGKALGGHIRVHNQAMKNNKSGISRIMDILMQRRNISPNMNLGRDAADVLSGPKRSQNWEEQICRICNRVFPSKKSLFGHMRFHPERTYRGARTPKSKEHGKTLSSSSEESDQDMEETESCHGDGEVSSSTGRDLLKMKDLPNWSKTNKRGRPSTSEVARSLMSLSCVASRVQCDEFLPGFNSHKYEPASPLKKLRFKDCSKIEANKGKHVDVHFQPASLTGKEFAPNRARQRKELDLNSAEKEETDRTDTVLNQNLRRVRFQCSTCGRIFPTFQALGGHRSSHDKEKGNTASASHNQQTLSSSTCLLFEASASTGAADAGRVHKEEARAEPSAAAAAGGSHQCGICKRSFTTGQALGGAQEVPLDNDEAAVG